MHGLFQSSPIVAALASNNTYSNSVLNHTVYPTQTEQRFGLNVIGFPFNQSFTGLSTMNNVLYQSFFGLDSSVFDRHVSPIRATFYSNYDEFQADFRMQVDDYINFNGHVNLEGTISAKFKGGQNLVFQDLLLQGKLVEFNCTLSGNANGTLFSKSDLALYFGDFDVNLNTNSTINTYYLNSTDEIQLETPAIQTRGEFIFISSSKFTINSYINLTAFTHFDTASMVKFAGTSSFLTTIDPFSSIEAIYKLKNTIINICIIFFILAMLAVIITKWRSKPKWTTRTIERDERDQQERAGNFLESYPPNTELVELTKMPTFSLLNIKEYEFTEPIPKVIVGGLYGNGKQRIQVKSRQVVTLQTNRMLTEVGILPPPSFESTELPERYYSVTIDQMDKDTIIGVGFATRPYPPFRLPGMEDISIAYHTSGNILHNKTRFAAPVARRGSIIGVGYRRIERIRVERHVIYDLVLFFVVDGVRIGDEFVCDGEKVYPTVGTNGNCKLLVDFGSANVFE
ncbi:Rsp5p-dependent ubiquitination, sorting of cargo proteins at the multivesicular body [Terramyces sp. JEL0728]|nr:Rsp5p-dependent ubiquitination, sorting of cargo proteins at the multivesicular body [Terramyces sp. JEL0728]